MLKLDHEFECLGQHQGDLSGTGNGPEQPVVCLTGNGILLGLIFLHVISPEPAMQMQMLFPASTVPA